MRKDRAIVLCSGGMNSAVLVAAARESAELTLVHCRWEHPAAPREQAGFEKIAQHFAIADRVILDLPGLAQRAADAAKEILPDPTARQLVPSLLAMGEWIARARQAAQIWIGLHAGRRAEGVPQSAERDADLREFLQLMECALNLADRPRPVTLEAPLVDLSAGEIIRLARRLDVPLKYAWSCLAGGDKPCEQCAGCKRRSAAFMLATTADPGTTPKTAPTA